MISQSNSRRFRSLWAPVTVACCMERDSSFLLAFGNPCCDFNIPVISECRKWNSWRELQFTCPTSMSRLWIYAVHALRVVTIEKLFLTARTSSMGTAGEAVVAFAHRSCHQFHGAQLASDHGCLYQISMYPFNELCFHKVNYRIIGRSFCSLWLSTCHCLW